MSTPSEYLFDNAAAEAEQRIDALSALFDPTTFRHFETLGIGPGWRCWEVGAGGPSVPNWLARRVGGSGHVLATDINTSWVTTAIDPGVEVRHHDVAHDAAPSEPFDLVHARLVLHHLPARAEALERMVGSLRPGGRLLIEDFDNIVPFACIDSHLHVHDQANKVRAGLCTLLTQRGADLEWARTLPRLLRDAGLTDVGADAYFPVAAPEVGTLHAANIGQVRSELIAQQLVTGEELDALLVAIAGGQLDLATAPLISAWGRRA